VGAEVERAVDGFRRVARKPRFAGTPSPAALAAPLSVVGHLTSPRVLAPASPGRAAPFYGAMLTVCETGCQSAAGPLSSAPPRRTGTGQVSAPSRCRDHAARLGAARLGDSLAVELSALTRAALVRIQVPQPVAPNLS